MKLSIIYCFKDRELSRIKRSVESLYPQLGNNDEIVFVDYGSNTNIKGEVENYLKDFLQIEYIYVEAQGRLWNRSHALNIGVKNSTSEYVMMADIDLIFSQSFLNKLKSQFQTTDLVNYQCHYLPQKFKKYDQLLNKPSKYAKCFKKSTNEGLGLMAVKKSLFEEVNGYDEYYRVWGMEDNDIIHRFKLIGKETTWLRPDSYVFHQWHPTSGIRTRENIAKGWQSQQSVYFKEKNKLIIRSQNWGESFSKRTIASQVIAPDFEYELTEYNPIYATYFIKNKLNEHEPNQVIRFSYNNTSIEELKKTNVFKLISWFNKWSKRIKFPMVLESDLYHFGDRSTIYDFRDIFHYFLLMNEKDLMDYYLSQRSQSIELTIMLKG
nr:glycosyltransferase family A protein [uncultured Brumimicrobium sp.]